MRLKAVARDVLATQKNIFVFPKVFTGEATHGTLQMQKLSE